MSLKHTPKPEVVLFSGDMASGIFAVLDDISALMDDVAVAAKVATRKTAGILGDDLAVNAEKATGFLSSRELPVLWAITKGSLINKLIIVPVALLLSAYLPAAVTWLLVSGGAYLAFEGAEKIFEFFFPHPKTDEPAADTDTNPQQAEKTKIRSAIATDFILSVEIVIIALGSVADESLPIRIAVVAIVALLATVGVYGLVALIVRMDDAGHHLLKSAAPNSWKQRIGNLLIKALPVIIKILAVVGTLALLLVSGGIFVHHIGFVHHMTIHWPQLLAEAVAGFTVGILLFTLFKMTTLILRAEK